MQAIDYEINQYINFGLKYILHSVGVIAKCQLPPPTISYQLVMPKTFLKHQLRLFKTITQIYSRKHHTVKSAAMKFLAAMSGLKYFFAKIGVNVEKTPVEN